MDDQPERRRRRLRILILFGLVLLLGYPVLLALSTRAGLSLGLQRDINAQRDLIRALNYSGNRDTAVRYGYDTGQPPIAPLDPEALNHQLADIQLRAAAPVPNSTPHPGPAATPKAAAVSPSASAAAGASPSSSASAPPGAPKPSSAPTTRPSPTTAPTASARPTPTPTASSCPSAPSGSEHLNLHASDQQSGNAVGGATVRIYYRGCLIATGTTNSAGRMTNVNNLAPDTTYSYVVSASGYQDATGSFDTQNSSNSTVKVEVAMTRA